MLNDFIYWRLDIYDLGPKIEWVAIANRYPLVDVVKCEKCGTWFVSTEEEKFCKKCSEINWDEIQEIL
jgi:uncharacterized OB-fold protein